MTTLKPNSIQDVINNIGSLKSVAVLRKEGDLLEAKVFISKTVIEIFNHYREAYTSQEIENMVEISMRLGYMLNGLDFDLFKQKAIAGEYKNRVQIIDGRNFDIKFFRLTPDVFLDWLQEYIFQRGEAFVTANKNTKPTENETSGKHIEILKVFADKATERENRPESKPEPDKYSIQAKNLQKWIENEFESEWKKQGQPLTVELNRKKYIDHKGYFVFKSDYAKNRYEEIHTQFAAELQSKVNQYEKCKCYNEGMYENCASLCQRHYLESGGENYVYEQVEKLINGKNAT